MAKKPCRVDVQSVMVYCKHCERDYHICFNCGVELWYYTYCSRQCLLNAGKRPCPKCYGWGDECSLDDGCLMLGYTTGSLIQTNNPQKSEKLLAATPVRVRGRILRKRKSDDEK